MMATPIGNLTDLSARAVAGLACADIVCAEDTRIASRLLNACGLSTHLVSVREHNEQAMAKRFVAGYQTTTLWCIYLMQERQLYLILALGWRILYGVTDFV